MPATDIRSSAPRRSALAARIAAPLVAGAMALLLGGWMLQPAPTVIAPAAERVQVRAISAVVEHPVPVQLPTLAVEPVVEQAAPAAPSWSIGINAVGMQAELDQCLWVRMDFSSAVTIPIVAAHNYCGGDIVLSMSVGEIVTLSGTGLDGTYVVTGDRQAWSDSPVLDAIAGMSADVILQTCYWSNDGSERLVSLQRIG